MAKYLISKLADPLLGLSTGILSYILWEHDGRNLPQRPEGRMISDLVYRRYHGLPPPSPPPPSSSSSGPSRA